MTDPRWTVKQRTLVYGDERDGFALIAGQDIRRLGRGAWGGSGALLTDRAFDALVAAVHDAARIPQLEAERDAALAVIGAVDAVIRHQFHIDLDSMVPEWTDRQRSAIRRARWCHVTDDSGLLSPPAPDTGEGDILPQTYFTTVEPVSPDTPTPTVVVERIEYPLPGATDEPDTPTPTGQT